MTPSHVTRNVTAHLHWHGMVVNLIYGMIHGRVGFASFALATIIGVSTTCITLFGNKATAMPRDLLHSTNFGQEAAKKECMAFRHIHSKHLSSLPYDVVHAPSVQIFKCRLKQHLGM